MQPKTARLLTDVRRAVHLADKADHVEPRLAFSLALVFITLGFPFLGKKKRGRLRLQMCDRNWGSTCISLIRGPTEPTSIPNRAVKGIVQPTNGASYPVTP